MTGTALSGINLFTMLGGANLLQGVGWLLDHWQGQGNGGQPDCRLTFSLCAVGVTVALAAYVFVRESRG